MVGPFRLVLEKNAFGNGLYMPFRELWGYELLFYLKKCFCETPYSKGTFDVLLEVVPLEAELFRHVSAAVSES